MVEQYTNSGCDSPMEALFRAAWELSGSRRVLTPDAKLDYKQQHPVGRYKADFLFSILDEAGKKKLLVVEIDGHDFHERTKQQAAHDKSRDRWMTGDGYDVMRFTGSEVYANPFQCASEVADHMYFLRYGVSLKRARAAAGFESIRKLLED